MSFAFLLNSLCYLGLCLLIGVGTGHMVKDFNVKVNYTRKINHFGLFFVPLLVDQFLPYKITPVTGLTRLAIIISLFVIMIKPIRSRLSFVNLIFLAYDRPEDRPHTMVWVITQLLGGFLVIIPLQVYLARHQQQGLLYIPVIINVFGDGLAEPVGIRFGKHKYKTRALFTKKTFERSFEGSAMVFLSAIVALLFTASFFTTTQLIVAFAVIPILLTLTEAFSPHTWDTPFLFLVGGISPLLILHFV